MTPEPIPPLCRAGVRPLIGYASRRPLFVYQNPARLWGEAGRTTMKRLAVGLVAAVLVAGLPGLAVGSEPDPEAVRRLMEQYERED